MTEPFPPRSPEQCLRYIRHRLSADEVRITCLLIKAYAAEAEHHGAVVAIEEADTRMQHYLDLIERKGADHG